MNSLKIAAILFIAILPTVAFSAPKAKAKTPAPIVTVYVCSVCHMHFSAVDAKKDHYKDAMDGGKLMPLKPTSPGGATNAMPGMKM